jgi:hypothetical protein
VIRKGFGKGRCWQCNEDGNVVHILLKRLEISKWRESLLSIKRRAVRCSLQDGNKLYLYCTIKHRGIPVYS